MGDQVGTAIGGTIYFVPMKEFVRILSLQVSPVQKASLFAALCRINTLYMIARAGSGHIGSSFSSMDIMSWLQLNEIYSPATLPLGGSSNIFFSSKGHDAPALYNTLIGLGKLEFDLIHKLRRISGLPGHPDISTPGIATNTGSLGMGVSKAKGMIFADRLQKRSRNIYVLTGDGELQEGQFWESLISAANNNLHELTVIIDHNKLQSDRPVSKVSDLGDIEAKLAAFGWNVSRCDGNNLSAFSSTLEATKKIDKKPKVIIADTVKGKGVSFMEHTAIDSDVEFYKFHSGAPTEDVYAKALDELVKTANIALAAVNLTALQLEAVTRPVAPAPKNLQRLVPAYTQALLDQARKNPNIVALDADLILDTGLIPFQDEFPDRFVECGIAEQDMVSQAGGMALQGLLPVVHSFACFLSARPNEQIYNNASENTKIIYVGSLAGVTPGGPGHSHQAVRDISALSGIPHLVMMEPSCGKELADLFDWAVNKNPTSVYMRIVSLPCEINYELPESYRPQLGRGVALTKGRDVAIIASGPVLLTEAIKVSEHFEAENLGSIKTINFPWLNYCDVEWLKNEIAECTLIVLLDNHYGAVGQGAFISSQLSDQLSSSQRICKIGIQGLPVCGTNAEVLSHHCCDSDSIIKRIIECKDTK